MICKIVRSLIHRLIRIEWIGLSVFIFPNNDRTTSTECARIEQMFSCAATPRQSMLLCKHVAFNMWVSSFCLQTEAVHLNPLQILFMTNDITRYRIKTAYSIFLLYDRCVHMISNVPYIHCDIDGFCFRISITYLEQFQHRHKQIREWFNLLKYLYILTS